MKRPLDGMTVLITGASAGIGLALATHLAHCGARLALAARRLDKLQALAAKLPNQPVCIRADVSRPDDCDSMIATAFDKLGRLDTLVLNAGYGLIRRAGETTFDEYQQIFATNVFGTTEPIRAALPRLIAQEPRAGLRAQLMIVSSAAARRGLPFFGAYAATKAAQLSIAQALRVELLSKQIAVTSVHPMSTQTEFFDAAEQTSARRLPRTRKTPRYSIDSVALAMTRAIQRPRREVWPAFGSRLLLNLTAMFPALADFAIARALK